MKSSLCCLFAMLAGCVACGQASASEVAGRPAAKLEFRRAETQHANGLIKVAAMPTGQTLYLHKAADITNSDVAEARVVNGDSETAAVRVKFTKAGAHKMAVLSKGHHGKPVAILIDGNVVSAPVIRGSLSDQAIIAGTFTKAEAERLAEDLNKK